MPDVVLDTNVLVSGLIASGGPTAAILEALTSEKIRLVTSIFLLRELTEVISRPHIVQKYPLVNLHAEILLDYLRLNSILTAGIPDKPVVIDDPDDDYVLACAVEGGASYVVSGDEHLLSLKEYLGIPILSPREFVDAVLNQL